MRPHQRDAARRFAAIMLVAAAIHGAIGGAPEKPAKAVDTDVPECHDERVDRDDHTSPFEGHTRDTEFEWLPPVEEVTPSG